jgi:hypothetical protein
MVSAISPIGRVLSIKNRKQVCDKGHTFFGNHCHACVMYKPPTRPIIFHAPETLLHSDYFNGIDYRNMITMRGRKIIND